MKTYYNEFDPKAAAWLRELIAGGQIPVGDVDTRSIVDVKPEDLYDYDQCHFFAGIGGWPFALQLAGWNRPVWTGSCPCQPFSIAGAGKGVADERHLWPQFARLISKCQPPVVFGEQVASKAGREWLAGVRTDLEGMAYAVGAADLCAAGVGAPHIRQRLFWVARAAGAGGDVGGVGIAYSAGWVSGEPSAEGPRHEGSSEPTGGSRRVEHAPGDGWVERGSESSGRGASGGREPCGVAEPGPQLPGRVLRGPGEGVGEADKRAPDQSGGSGGSGFWSDYELIPCRDGKVRRIEPGTFPLAHGVPGRVGLLRGYGNAIVPEVAAEFVSAFREG